MSVLLCSPDSNTVPGPLLLPCPSCPDLDRRVQRDALVENERPLTEVVNEREVRSGLHSLLMSEAVGSS